MLWHGRTSAGREFQMDDECTPSHGSVSVRSTIIHGRLTLRVGAMICIRSLRYTPASRSLKIEPLCMWPGDSLEDLSTEKRASVGASSALADDSQPVVLDALKLVKSRLSSAPYWRALQQQRLYSTKSRPITSCLSGIVTVVLVVTLLFRPL